MTELSAFEEAHAFRRKEASINKRHDGTIYRHTERINGARQKELSDLRAALSPEAHALLWPQKEPAPEDPEPEEPKRGRK